MPIFGAGKKKDSSKGAPTDLVMQMRQQGLSNNQIIQNLQRMGHATTDIFDAMSQADLKSNIDAAPIEGFSNSAVENPMSFGGMGSPSGMGPPPAMDMGAMQGPPQGSMPMSLSSSMPSLQGGVSKEEMEEIVEQIIDEKWAEIAGSINKIVEWKGKVESRLAAIEEQMKDTQKQFDDLRQSVLNKVGEYDQHITTVGTDVKAMEQVFQKMLPLFAENVRELSRITDNLKTVSSADKKKI